MAKLNTIKTKWVAQLMVLSENHNHQDLAVFKTKNKNCKYNIRIGTQELRVILTNKTDDLKQEVLKKQDVI